MAKKKQVNIENRAIRFAALRKWWSQQKDRMPTLPKNLKIKNPFKGRRFYIITTIIFIVWLIFFDSNDVFTQYQRRQRLMDLQKQKKYYQQAIHEAKKKQKKVNDDWSTLERIARQNYLLKKANEDLYIIEEEEEAEDTLRQK